MTINATAAILLMLYETGPPARLDPHRLRGKIQKIPQEYIARGTYIFPPGPSMRLVTDTFAYCRTELPAWNTISISGYHMREAGATAIQEVAFTVANAIAYADAALAAGMAFDDFAPRLSFFFAAHGDLLEEVAKFRAARRTWATVARDRFGATNPKSLAMRFHVQTADSTLTAQQPDVNVVRTTVQALAAVLAGPSRCTRMRWTRRSAFRPLNRRLALGLNKCCITRPGGGDRGSLAGSYTSRRSPRRSTPMRWPARAHRRPGWDLGRSRRATSRTQSAMPLRGAARRRVRGRSSLASTPHRRGDEQRPAPQAIDPELERQQVEDALVRAAGRGRRRVRDRRTHRRGVGNENVVPRIAPRSRPTSPSARSPPRCAACGASTAHELSARSITWRSSSARSTHHSSAIASFVSSSRRHAADVRPQRVRLVFLPTGPEPSARWSSSSRRTKPAASPDTRLAARGPPRLPVDR